MILRELQQVMPSFVSRVDRPDRGGEWISYLEQRRERDRALGLAARPRPPRRGRRRALGRADPRRRHRGGPARLLPVRGRRRAGDRDPRPARRPRPRRAGRAARGAGRRARQPPPPARARLRGPSLPLRDRLRLRRLPRPAAPPDADLPVAAARPRPRRRRAGGGPAEAGAGGDTSARSRSRAPSTSGWSTPDCRAGALRALPRLPDPLRARPQRARGDAPDRAPLRPRGAPDLPRRRAGDARADRRGPPGVRRRDDPRRHRSSRGWSGSSARSGLSESGPRQASPSRAPPPTGGACASCAGRRHPNLVVVAVGIVDLGNVDVDHCRRREFRRDFFTGGGPGDRFPRLPKPAAGRPAVCRSAAARSRSTRSARTGPEARSAASAERHPQRAPEARQAPAPAQPRGSCRGARRRAGCRRPGQSRWQRRGCRSRARCSLCRPRPWCRRSPGRASCRLCQYPSPNSFEPLSRGSELQLLASLAVSVDFALPLLNWSAASLVAAALSSPEREERRGDDQPDQLGFHLIAARAGGAEEEESARPQHDKADRLEDPPRRSRRSCVRGPSGSLPLPSDRYRL